MRELCAPRGSRTRWRSTSAGTGGVARGRAARRARGGHGGRPRRGDRGRRPAGRRRGLRPCRPPAGDGPRQPRRAAGARPGPARSGRRSACCASFDPEAARPGELDVPDPYYGGAGRVRARPRRRHGRLPRAAGRAAGGRPRVTTARRWPPRPPAPSASPVTARAPRRRRRPQRGLRARRSPTAAARSPRRAPDAAPGAYAAEAAGLAWLAQAGALAVPEVLAVADDPGEDPRLLVLAGCRSARRGPGLAEALGRGLAAVHDAGAPAPRRAAAGDGRRRPAAGAARAARRRRPRDWPSCYAEQRVAPLLRAAQDRGALPDGCAARVERRPGPAAGARRAAGAAGAPARRPLGRQRARGGGRDAPGARRPGRPRRAPRGRPGHAARSSARRAAWSASSPPTREVHPLADGHAERVALWQLFPLLVHAVLFGGGYGAAVDRAARAYA